jgi:hypothetical protein
MIENRTIISINSWVVKSFEVWLASLVLASMKLMNLCQYYALKRITYSLLQTFARQQFWRLKQTLSLVSQQVKSRGAVIMYVETFKTDIIIFIGNTMMCLMSYWPIIFNTRVSSLLLTICINWYRTVCFKSNWNVLAIILIASFLKVYLCILINLPIIWFRSIWILYSKKK